MTYLFKGRLCGYICAECPEPLANLRVRLYRVDKERNIAALAVANPKETFAILEDNQVQDKESRLLAEAATDREGNFTFELGKNYGGEAFEVDVYCGSVPRQKIGKKPPKPRQFTITTLQPRFRETENGFIAVWDYCLPYRFWCAVLAWFDVWTICGRVVDCETKRPVAGVKVNAFDADWLADDELGFAFTDAAGKFIITYSSVDFRQGTWIDVELIGGPDLYFRIEDPAGNPLLTETQIDGRTPARENATNCFCVELCIEEPPLICEITEPSGCVHGDPTLLAAHVLEPIVGTASGLGFSRYELEVVYAGSSIPAAVIYANLGGNPDTTLTFGNHQVTNGALGFVDIKQAVIGAGVGFLTNTNFEVRLHVVRANGSRHTCTITFQLASARSFIKKVGTAWAHNFTDPNDPLCAAAPPLPHALVPASVGGSIYVRGAANAYGCAAEKISELHLWAIPDATFSFAQPVNGTPSVVPAGGVQISEVTYTTNAQRTSNSLDGTSDWGDILTYAPGWTTRIEWVLADLGLMIPIIVPDIVEIPWPTGASGKYTLLLEVKDTVGNTYYDVQRVWVDNDLPTANIRSIGGVAACVDLKLSTYVGTTAEIRGIAWDLPIRGVDPQTAPNDNFKDYSMSFQKNGGAVGSIPVVGGRVPNIWPGPLVPANEGVLANWNIVAALDGGLAPGPAQLRRGERCAYVIALHVSDKTLVGEGPYNHVATHLYAINVINDIV